MSFDFPMQTMDNLYYLKKILRSPHVVPPVDIQKEILIE